jgi:DNA/RNA-binding domain of Phe-tRNA-synthetase-like protein
VATGREQYVRLNGQEQQLKEGDMFIADTQGVLSAVIYGPDSRTRIGPGTRRAFFTVYAPPGIGEEAVYEHRKDIEANIRLFAPEAEPELMQVYGTG